VGSIKTSPGMSPTQFEYSGTLVVERLSSRTNRFPNIKPKQKTHRFPNRQTGNQVREMYGGRASVTSQPPLSAASRSNLLCLFLIFFALFQRCLEVTSDTKLTLTEFWKNHFNILHCLSIIDKDWGQMTYRTMNSAWREIVARLRSRQRH
jgi:hypothetical protein